MFTQAHPRNQSQALFLSPDSFPNSYLRDVWNCTIHGQGSQVLIADLSGCCHSFPCQRMGPCVIVNSRPQGRISPERIPWWRNKTKLLERTLFMVGATHSTLKALSAMNQHKLLHERPWEPKQLSNFIKLKAYDKYCILYLYEYDLSHAPSPFLHLSQGPHICSVAWPPNAWSHHASSMSSRAAHRARDCPKDGP